MRRPYGVKIMYLNPDIRHRRSIRLAEYDYTGAGAYFVTACAHGRECLFGDVVDEVVRLNEFGGIVRECWNSIPEHFTGVALDEYVVMPNHFHGIVIIQHDRRGDTCVAHVCDGNVDVGATRRVAHGFNGNDDVGARHASPMIASPTDWSPTHVGSTHVGSTHVGATYVGATHASPLRSGPSPSSVGAIVGSFKSAVTKRINRIRGNLGVPGWQRNYFERVIRNDRELAAIREYIGNNPVKWAIDRENPANNRHP